MKPKELENIKKDHEQILSDLKVDVIFIRGALNRYPNNFKIKRLKDLLSSFECVLNNYNEDMLKNVPEEEDLADITCWDSDEIDQVIYNYVEGDISYEEAKKKIKEIEAKYEKEEKEGVLVELDTREGEI